MADKLTHYIVVVAEITAEVATEVAAVAAKVLIIQLNQGVGNLIYYYIVVQAGSGFNINTGAALCSTVTSRLGYHL